MDDHVPFANQDPMVTIIVAHDEAGAIGFKDGLPWPRIKEDMNLFRQCTLGHTVLMGRKTYETLGKPLPDRENIVVSRNKFYSLDHEGIVSTPELIPTIKTFKKMKKHLFIIGGAEIYKQSLPFVDRLLITEVYGTHEADTFWTPDTTYFKMIAGGTFGKWANPKCMFTEYLRKPS